jgi:hypothetical protein
VTVSAVEPGVIAAAASSTPASVEAQVDAFASARGTLAALTVRQVTLALAQFDGWYATGDITALSQRIAALVTAGARQTAALTDAYLSQVSTALAERDVPPVGVTGVARRQGVDTDAAYGRLADTYRWRVAEGDEPEVARSKVNSRAEAMVDTDLGLAFRGQAQRFIEARPVSSWRRVIRPEVSRGGTCALCVVAAERIYYKHDLMALHARCNCTVLPIIGGIDPGQRLNKADFATIYGAAGGTSTKALISSKGRYTVKEHGELGPVLVAAGDEFRTATTADRQETH